MNKEQRHQALVERLEVMKEYERELYAKGVKVICGMDEVGRGPLAGPVVAAAVILPEDFHILGVDDSKKISEKKRNELFDKIHQEDLAISIGIVDNFKIDEINILEATKLAMKEAVERLEIKPEHILIDALTLKDVDIPQTGIIKGDANSVSIAAASIIAKVTRDRMMEEFHQKWTHYAFDKNKGYGTKAHYAGIEEHGVCEIHRRTFLKGVL